MNNGSESTVKISRAGTWSAGILTILAVLLLAGCTGEAGEQAGKKEANKECAKTDPEVAGSGMSKPGKIAFSKNGDIYTMNPDGSGQTNLTAKEFGNEFYEGEPAWSPDSKKIAFASDRESSDDIYVMNTDGTNVTRLTESPDDELTRRWSPDGNKIGFSAEGSEGPAVSVMNAEGTDTTTVRKGPASGFIGMSDWSPDGSRILFGVDRSPAGGEIDTYVMNEDGTCVKQLTDAPGDDSSAEWSPDGERILFGSNRKGGGIYLMNPDGTNQRRVLKAPPDEAGLDTFRPAWSPDGKKIAWSGKYEGDIGSKIYVMNADGSGLTAIHSKLEMAPYVDWQPVR